MKALVLAVLMFCSTNILTAPAPVMPKMGEFHCLVKNIYMEARGESKQGKIAVARVTLNRVSHPDYPKSICKVVYQPKQFSWTIKPSKAKINPEEWFQSIDAASIAYNTKGFKATHYHNFTVKPKWGLKKIAVIGQHIFYI